MSPRQHNSLKGSVWCNWPGGGCNSARRLSAATFADKQPYDVAIVGAGVVGCAIAYQLAQYQLRVIMIDRAFDVGEGTSKGNSAIIHTGFDAVPGSLESQLVTSASRQWPQLAENLKIPFKQVSASMLALNEVQLAQLPALREKALANGVNDVELLSADETRRLEANVSPAVLGSLSIPRESIVDPFITSIAFAEVAIGNGADLALGLEIVDAVDLDAPVKTLVGQDGVRIAARYVVNSCGLWSRKFVDVYGGEPMDLNPRRGQFVIYDSDCSHLINRILLPIPTQETKGMLVAPTIFGNLLAGPTAEDLPAGDNHATQTTASGLRQVRENSISMCPALADHSVIATYAGLRCNCAQGSYWIRFNDAHKGIVTLAGIRSTGLTASISIAQHVVDGMGKQCGLPLVRNPEAKNSRRDTRWPGWWRRPYDDPLRVKNHPEYGRIVCSCENISLGEIRDAVKESFGMATLDGLKRRTRVLTGRCQGFHCCVTAAEVISEQSEIPLAAVTKRGPGTEIIAANENEAVRPVSREKRWQPKDSRELHFRVVIVGAGPAGIGVAVGLAKRAIGNVLLVDRADEIGGIPAKYAKKPGGVPTFVDWRRGRVLFGQPFVKILRRKLDGTPTQVWLESQVVAVDGNARSLTVVSPHLGKMTITADAVVFACGAREKTRSERGWLSGNRPSRQFHTMNLLELLDRHDLLPIRRPAIVGSDLISYSAAAKLCAAGADEAVMFDRSTRPKLRLIERLYFRRWCKPRWFRAQGALVLPDYGTVSTVELDGESHFPCDGVVVSGELVPNSELAVAAGMKVDPVARVPVLSDSGELSHPGWFVSGAEVGGFHGAQWCYSHGLGVARSVAVYLSRST